MIQDLRTYAADERVDPAMTKDAREMAERLEIDGKHLQGHVKTDQRGLVDAMAKLAIEAHP